MQKFNTTKTLQNYKQNFEQKTKKFIFAIAKSLRNFEFFKFLYSKSTIAS